MGIKPVMYRGYTITINDESVLGRIATVIKPGERHPLVSCCGGDTSTRALRKRARAAIDLELTRQRGERTLSQ